MITRDNIHDVIQMLDSKQKKRIASLNWEYVVLELHCFNAGSFLTARCTNDYNRYKNVSAAGNCILSIDDEIFEGVLNYE